MRLHQLLDYAEVVNRMGETTEYLLFAEEE